MKGTDYSKLFYCISHGRWMSTHRFWRDKTRTFGLKTQCKDCIRYR